MTPPGEEMKLVELCQRLRKIDSDSIGEGLARSWHRNPDGPEAADRIEQLVGDRDRAVEALRPFADLGHMVTDGPFCAALFGDDEVPTDLTWTDDGKHYRITWADFRKARAFLDSLGER